MIAIFVAQCVGCFAGVFLAWLSLMYNGTNIYVAKNEGARVPVYNLNAFELKRTLKDGTKVFTASEDWLSAFWIEMLCTFVFVMINLVVKSNVTTPSKERFFCHLSVALALLGMIDIANDFTGAFLNPAVAIAQVSFILTQITDVEKMTKDYQSPLWIWTIAPCVGAILAGFFFKLHSKCYEKINAQQSGSSDILQRTLEKNQKE